MRSCGSDVKGRARLTDVHHVRLLLSLITAGLESARASARSVAYLIGKPMWAELRPVSGRPCGSPDSLRCSPASE